jgi:Holliday junction resolvase RusA-like endonuclease
MSETDARHAEHAWSGTYEFCPKLCACGHPRADHIYYHGACRGTVACDCREFHEPSGLPIVLEVVGEPRPKGSKTAIVVGGRARVIESKSANGRARQQTWKDAVARAACDWREQHPGEPLDEPLAVSILFRLPRPKSAARRITQPAKKPDLDKLCRTVLDELRNIVYRDDALVVTLFLAKSFAVNEPPGARITIASAQ